MTLFLPFSTLFLLSSTFVCLLSSAFPQHEFEIIGQNDTSPEHNVSSEFIFSPEKEYINDKEVNAMLTEDSRGPEFPPFDEEERLASTSPKPDGLWKKLKKWVRLGRTTEKLPWNVTKEAHRHWVMRHLRTMHNYVRYTLLNRPTPNATETEPTTKDGMDFWREHYTDWKFFNRLHFEIMNASNPEEHWFYRTLMAEGHGVNLEEFSTTTPLYIDINRMTGFSANLTDPTTEPPEPDDSEIDSADIPPEVKAAMTLRPAFHKAIDAYFEKIEWSTLPSVEFPPPGATSYFDGPKYKAMLKKLASFYYITTRDPEEWMDTYERGRHAKLKKHLVKMEKRMLDSISREVNAYTMDFGPKFNAFSRDVMDKIKRTTSRFDRMEKEEVDAATQQTEATTNNAPEFVQKAFASGAMVNVTILEKWLYEHCANNTIDWATEAPPTKPTFFTVDITERTEKVTEATGSTMSSFHIPEADKERILGDNFTFNFRDEEHLMQVAQRHMRNLSLFKIEKNYALASKHMYEAQFTTTPASPESEEIKNMFTHKMGNY